MKKAYAKVKAEEEAAQRTLAGLTNDGNNSVPATGSLELHPDRQAMLKDDNAQDLQKQSSNDHDKQRSPHFDSQPGRRKIKQSRFKKEIELAAQHRVEQEAKIKAREAREKDRKAMAKAKRPGKDGKLKLGRQGTVLLSRIQRMTEDGKI